ncbi:hypothetical protein KDAU_13450 [Dictyobacter aurantiacus]|uniref:Uncharacterized protein n=1 Tax=Dictyobacter aurantiacus TaxID=1936993 RepID=A0A401ZB17_9CHLR|nr:hypothetical protein KDAU_13450 [Dictyobacter aurantiacus]
MVTVINNAIIIAVKNIKFLLCVGAVGARMRPHSTNTQKKPMWPARIAATDSGARRGGVLYSGGNNSPSS